MMQSMAPHVPDRSVLVVLAVDFADYADIFV